MGSLQIPESKLTGAARNRIISFPLVAHWEESGPTRRQAWSQYSLKRDTIRGGLWISNSISISPEKVGDGVAEGEDDLHDLPGGVVGREGEEGWEGGEVLGLGF